MERGGGHERHPAVERERSTERKEEPVSEKAEVVEVTACRHGPPCTSSKYIANALDLINNILGQSHGFQNMKWFWFGPFDMGRKLWKFIQWETTCVSASWVAICLASGSKSMPCDNRSPTAVTAVWIVLTMNGQLWKLFRRNFSSLPKIVWYAGTCLTLWRLGCGGHLERRGSVRLQIGGLVGRLKQMVMMQCTFFLAGGSSLSWSKRFWLDSSSGFWFVFGSSSSLRCWLQWAVSVAHTGNSWHSSWEHFKGEWKWLREYWSEFGFLDGNHGWNNLRMVEERGTKAWQRAKNAFWIFGLATLQRLDWIMDVGGQMGLCTWQTWHRGPYDCNYITYCFFKSDWIANALGKCLEVPWLHTWPRKGNENDGCLLVGSYKDGQRKGDGLFGSKLPLKMLAAAKNKTMPP